MAEKDTYERSDEGAMWTRIIAGGIAQGLNPALFQKGIVFIPSVDLAVDAVGAWIVVVAPHGELLVFRENESSPYNLIGGNKLEGETGGEDTARREAAEEIPGVDWRAQPLTPLGQLQAVGAVFNILYTELTPDQCRAIGQANDPQEVGKFDFISRDHQETIANSIGGAFQALFDVVQVRRSVRIS
jgi:hypothetical protein